MGSTLPHVDHTVQPVRAAMITDRLRELFVAVLTRESGGFGHLIHTCSSNGSTTPQFIGRMAYPIFLRRFVSFMMDHPQEVGLRVRDKTTCGLIGEHR